MKIVLNVISEEVVGMYPDTATISIDESGLNVNGSMDPTVTSSGNRIIDDVTPELFLLGLINESWRYHHA